MTMTSNHSLTNIMNEYWPKRAVRVSCGDHEWYFGANCGGLTEMVEEDLEVLDRLNPLHTWVGYKEVEVMYRKQKVGTFSIEKY